MGGQPQYDFYRSRFRLIAAERSYRTRSRFDSDGIFSRHRQQSALAPRSTVIVAAVCFGAVLLKPWTAIPVLSSQRWKGATHISTNSKTEWNSARWLPTTSSGVTISIAVANRVEACSSHRSAVYLFQVGGIEQPIGAPHGDIRRSAAKGEEKRGAMILHVDRLTTLNDGYMRVAIDIAPGL